MNQGCVTTENKRRLVFRDYNAESRRYFELANRSFDLSLDDEGGLYLSLGVYFEALALHSVDPDLTTRFYRRNIDGLSMLEPLSVKLGRPLQLNEAGSAFASRNYSLIIMFKEGEETALILESCYKGAGLGFDRKVSFIDGSEIGKTIENIDPRFWSDEQ